MSEYRKVWIEVTIRDLEQLREYAMQRALVDAKMPAQEFTDAESADPEDNINYWIGWAFDAGTPEGCGFQIENSGVE